METKFFRRCSLEVKFLSLTDTWDHDACLCEAGMEILISLLSLSYRWAGAVIGEADSVLQV